MNCVHGVNISSAAKTHQTNMERHATETYSGGATTVIFYILNVELEFSEMAAVFNAVTHKKQYT